MPTKKKAAKNHTKEITLEERVGDLEVRLDELEEQLEEQQVEQTSPPNQPVTQEEFDQFKKDLHEAGIRLLRGYSPDQAGQ